MAAVLQRLATQSGIARSATQPTTLSA